MSYSEQDARERARSDLCELLVAADTSRRSHLNQLSQLSDAALWQQMILKLHSMVTHITPMYSIMLAAVLRAGAVRRLLRMILDFSSLAAEHDPRRAVIMNNLTWHKALEAAVHLSVALDEHPTLPEVSEAYSEWRSFTIDLITAFGKNEYLTIFAPAHDGLVVFRLRCLRILHPMYSIFNYNQFSRDQLPFSVQDLRQILKLVAAIRATIRTTPASEFQNTLWKLSAKALCSCILGCQRQIDAETVEGINLAEIAGVSYNELLRQCLSLGDDSPETVDPFSDQLDVLCSLLDADGTDALSRVVIQKQVMARCGTLMRASWDWKGVDAELLASFRLQIISLWRLILGRAISNSRLDTQPAREMLDSRYLFQLERWSISAPDAQLDNVDHIVAVIGVTLIAVQDIETTRPQLGQTRVIYNRLASRPDVRPSVINIWRSIVPEAKGTGIVGTNNVCGAIGCDAVEAAWQLCSGCNSQIYCSRECQKLDWKSHKPHCQKSKPRK